MREHLTTLGVATKRFLTAHLPDMSEDWWDRGVIGALSYPQRRLAGERGWSTLDDLDIASLLRVVDGNWDYLRQRKAVSYESRNWLKEAVSIRNRLAHEPPGGQRDHRQDYRDLDTLALFTAAMDASSSETAALEAARDKAMAALTSAPQAAPALPSYASVSIGDLSLGAQVRLVSRPEVVGIVARVSGSGAERQVTVFHDGALHAYFESQIEFAAIGTPATIDPDAMRAGLTAGLLLQPSTSRLYSFNSGRIDYEPYQFRPVMKLINSDRPRLLIADDVGVGKTIEAGLIIKELQARQKLDSILVICPKQLVVEGKWRSELKRFDEDFVELDSQALRYCLEETRLEGEWPSRYKKAILPYSLLDEALLLGQGEGRRRRHGLLSLLPPVKFDLVIVDEAHHVRNRETWAHRVVDHLLGSADAAVLISATPIQTGTSDLFNLLRLLRPDLITGPAEFDRMREPNGFIASAEAITRRGEPDWPIAALVELEKALATAWGSAVFLADPRAESVRELLKKENPTEVTRVRVVRALQSMNTFSGLINRTRRRDIGSFTTRKPETVEVDFTPEQEAVYNDLLDLCASIVSAWQRQQQPLEFLLSTLKRQASSSINGLAPFVQDLLENRLNREELSETDFEGELLPPDELVEFRSAIRDLADRAGALVDDPKLDALLAIVEEKQRMANSKLLVFSTFRHTLLYLLPRLETAGVRVGLVHGGVPDRTRRDIRAQFALDRDDPDALDVLLSSEVGTEGLDNQFCDAMVNYDIPWNPMRIEQRIGRIDRRGQKSPTISVKNLVVSGTVDAAIYERCLWRIGIFRESLGAGEEILGELTREMRAIAEDLSLTPEERDARLQQLADNKIARIQEQSELEDRESSLFGLAVQKIDEDGIEALASPWLSREQLSGLVKRYLLAKGYIRADQLFERPVGILRPDKQVRAALLQDARSLGVTGVVVARWTRWLEGSGDGTRRLTFDPQLASDDDVELLSPTHPLVRAAADHVRGLAPGSTISLKVRSSDVPSGRYPFAIYGWKTLGVRDNYEFKVLASDSTVEAALEQLLLVAEPGSAAIGPDEAEALERRHYERWVATRGEHIDTTEAHVAAQLSSLKLSHSARISQLEEQLAEAGHPNIVRMREGALRSVEEDFERRSQELLQAVARADVTTDMLCRGTLEVM